MNPSEIVQLISLVLEFGIPAINDAIAQIKSAQGKEPTVDDIRALLSGLKPPDEY